jgi:hypothetical protein
MAEMIDPNRVRLARMIFVPSLLALAVTLLRLAGELRHWSPRWFDTEGAGITPSGWSWLIGISWLAVPFGAYFAARLIRAGQGPASAVRAMAYAVGGVLILYIGQRLMVSSSDFGLRTRLLMIWAVSVGPAMIVILAWPALWRALLAYGLASRIPVAVIMFLAMRGTWGTHYDYSGQVPRDELGFYYVWFGLVPQLVFWVGFTILVGMLAGAITAAVYRRRQPSAETAALKATTY